MDIGTARADAGKESSSASTVFNIASYLPQMAENAPQRVAVTAKSPNRRPGSVDHVSLTFAELEHRSNACASGFTEIGIEKGTRVLVMIRPGFEFLETVFALFKMGAVPVLIDPGMGLRRMLNCIRQIRPKALIGIPQAHALRALKPAAFESVVCSVTVGRRWFWGGPTLAKLRDGANSECGAVETGPNDVAAILFTSGATGPPKGVVYEHGMFGAQVRSIQSHYGIESGEIDLPTFPLFALFGPAMGMTCVIPDMNPAKPAQVRPERIVDAIRMHGVTNTFGSPALWERVANYCIARRIKLPSLRRVLVAGAPVAPDLIERLHKVLGSHADVHTPYGATESLPVSSIAGREVIEDCAHLSRRGAGICVGRELPGVDLRFIRISDGPVAEWSDELEVDDGALGEITVSGEIVTKEYSSLPDATEMAKIRQGARVWHRIGDIGYRDGQGRIWFCGRKAHRVVTEKGTLFTVRCEAVFNQHPDVRRSALVGVGPSGAIRPVIIIELASGRVPGKAARETLAGELLALGQDNELTRDIREVIFHKCLPVDRRHNAKIDREALATFATRHHK